MTFGLCILHFGLHLRQRMQSLLVFGRNKIKLIDRRLVFKAEIDQFLVDSLKLFSHDFRLGRARYCIIITCEHASCRCLSKCRSGSSALQMFEIVVLRNLLLILVSFWRHFQLFIVVGFWQSGLLGFPESLESILLCCLVTTIARRCAIEWSDINGRCGTFLLHVIELKEQVVKLAKASLALDDV